MSIRQSILPRWRSLQRTRYFPWILPILIIVLLLLYWADSVQSHRRETVASYKQSIAHALALLQERYSVYENVILATRSIYLNTGTVKDEAWHHFIDSMKVLKNYPGIESIAFAAYRGREGGGICPIDGDADTLASLPAAQRGFSVVVSNIEPDALSSSLLGYDFASEPKTLLALHNSCLQQRAILSGAMLEAVHGHYIVRQTLPVFDTSGLSADNESAMGVLTGWLVLTFDAKYWLENFGTVLKSRDFSLTISDGDEAPFYDSRPPGYQAAYAKQLDVPLGGHLWRATFYSSPDFEQHQLTPFIHLLPITGLLLTLLLLAVIRGLQGSRQQAMEQALQISEQLRQSEERYRVLFEGSSAVKLLIDPQDGAIIDANNAAATYYGYSREQLKSMHISDINTLSQKEIEREMRRANEEQRNHFIFRHRLANDEVRDVEVHSGPINVGGKQLLYSIIHDVTARIHGERALRESEERYHTIITTAGEGYWLIDLGSFLILEVNDALCQMLGYSREELIGRQPYEFVDEENRRIFAYQMAEKDSRMQRSYEVVLKHKDGHDVIVHLNATNMPHGPKGAVQSFAFITDITDWRRSEEQLRIAATFFETTSEAIIVTNSQNKIIAVNPSFTRITGYSEDEVLGSDPKFLSSGRNDQLFYQEMWQSLLQTGRWQGEIWNRRKDGNIYPEWLSIVVIEGDDEKKKQYMAVFSDITKRKKDEEKIWRQANYDNLTGLPNRNLFKDRLEQAMHTALREHSLLALMFIDLDRFKWVNDTMGHASGDLLLQEAASRLTRNLRITDTVARLGGDEFTVLLNDVGNEGQVDHIAEKLLRQLSEPFNMEGREAYISGSIGITLYPGDANDMEHLLANADAAMYSAKAAGRNMFRYFTQEMNMAAQRRLHLETDLRRAQQNGELRLHYQPVHDIDGAVVGAEALLRWKHPELGDIPPEEFVPLAEDVGVIVAIEQWAIHQACMDTLQFQQLTTDDFYIAVNISSMQCKSDKYQAVLREALAGCAINPSTIKLEITERVMMENTEDVIGLLREVRDMGVLLAVDDFGTGYSSLSYLKQFPVNVLKIDRTFIAGLPDDKDDVALVEAIVAMAHSLNLKVVAEGVETAEQLTFLQSTGCDQIQGFYYSVPLAFTDFVAYLQRHN